MPAPDARGCSVEAQARVCDRAGLGPSLETGGWTLPASCHSSALYSVSHAPVVRLSACPSWVDFVDKGDAPVPVLGERRVIRDLVIIDVEPEWCRHPQH